MEHEPDREYCHMRELVVMGPRTKEKQIYYRKPQNSCRVHYEPRWIDR